MYKVIFLFLLSPQLLLATEYYVRCSTGSDASAGTSWGAAFLTIQKCLDSASSGDTCNISDNETCTSVFTDAGITNTDNTNPIIITGADDGGSGVISFPDMRADIDDVATIDLSAVTTAYSVAFNGGYSFIFKNLKIIVPDVSYGFSFTSSVVYFHNVEWSDAGLTGLRHTIYSSGARFNFKNNFINKINTSGEFMYSQTNGGIEFDWRNNYIRIHTNDTPISRGRFRTGCPSSWTENIFEITGTGNTNGIISVNVNRVGQVENNTFISSGAINTVGVTFQPDEGTFADFKNNIFYNFTGTGSKPVKIAGNYVSFSSYGNNGFYSSNAPDAPVSRNVLVDLTGDDIVKAGTNPFVDSANNDYTLISAEQGTATNGVDIGATQSGVSGGGGTTTVIIPHGSVQ